MAQGPRQATMHVVRLAASEQNLDVRGRYVDLHAVV
jgi:hypothetical protein